MNQPFKILGSLKARLLMAALIVIIVSLSLGGYVLSLAFKDTLQRDFDARMEVIMDDMIGASEVSIEGSLGYTRSIFDQRFETPYSGYYWQVSEVDKPDFRSRSLWDFELKSDLSKRLFNTTWGSVSGPDGQQLRRVEQDIILPESDRVFRYMVAVDITPLQEEEKRFNGLLLASFALIAATIMIAILLQVTYGMRPLAIIGKKLQKIRGGEDIHLDGPWPNEIEPLAHEINALIDHNKTVVERARTHAGNLAHALKTPLTILSNEAQSGKNTLSPSELSEQVEHMQDHIDHHLRRARIAGRSAGGRVSIKQTLLKIIKIVSRINFDKKIDFKVNCPEGISFRGEAEDFNEVVGNLLENAAKWAKGRVEIKVRPIGSEEFELTVADDGAGVEESEFNKLFERGKRLDETISGTGLGLSIVKDIVDAYAGKAEISTSELGGLQVSVILPRVL